MHLAIVVGTNRKSGLSYLLCQHLIEIYQARECSVDCIDLREMSPDFLNPDAYKNKSDAVRAMVQRFLDADAVVFIVPEYNGSYPGALKLFIDMLPYPQGFERRPCAFIGLAAGQFQGLRAVEHLQQVSGYRNAFNYARRVFIGDSYKQFEQDGSLKDEALEQRLVQQAEGFLDYVRSLTPLGGPAKSA